MSVNVEKYERNLPPYLAHDLEAWKKGVEEKSHLVAARHKALFWK